MRGRVGAVRGGGIKNVLAVVVGDGVVVADVPLTLAAASKVSCRGRSTGTRGSVPPAYRRSSGVAVFLRA